MHVKTNTTGYADALICEAEGLESLRDGLQQAGVEALRIPEVMEVNQHRLTLRRIDSAPPDDKCLTALGGEGGWRSCTCWLGINMAGAATTSLVWHLNPIR